MQHVIDGFLGSLARKTEAPEAYAPLDDSEKEFAAKLKPSLERLEDVRLEKYDLYLWRKKIGMWSSGIIVPVTGYIDYLLLMWSSKSSDDDGGAGLTFLVMGAIWWWVTQPKRDYAKAYKKEILPELARSIGDLRYIPDAKLSMQDYSWSRIIPVHDRCRTDDCFEGTHRGATVRFAEIELTKRQRNGKKSRTVTVFKGVLIDIALQKSHFQGHTILVRNQASVFEWISEKTSSLKRADLVDPVFEKKYSVFTNDQVEARYLLHPAMVERIGGIENVFGTAGGGLSACWLSGQVLLLLPVRRNLFEPADITVPATDPLSIAVMRRELAAVFSLMDEMELLRKNS